MRRVVAWGARPGDIQVGSSLDLLRASQQRDAALIRSGYLPALLPTPWQRLALQMRAVGVAWGKMAEQMGRAAQQIASAYGRALREAYGHALRETAP